MIPYIAALILLLIPGSLYAAAYARLETEGFRFHYTAGDEKMVHRFTGAAREIRKSILHDLRVSFPESMDIWLAPTLEDYQSLQPGRRRVPVWSAAVAYPEQNLIILRSPKAVRGARLDYRRVLAHEITHIVLARIFPDRQVPVWLHEGLAIYEAREWELERTLTLMQASLTNRLIPLNTLTHSFPDEGSRAELAYAQSFMFVTFLMHHFAEDTFQRFFTDYRDHDDLERALHRATGRHMDELESEWLSYILLRASWIPLITSATTLWFLLTLIFLYGYIRKRRKAMSTLKAWEKEEEQEQS